VIKMCARPDSTYGIEEEELVERFRTGEINLQEFENQLAALRKFWTDLESGKWDKH